MQNHSSPCITSPQRAFSIHPVDINDGYAAGDRCCNTGFLGSFCNTVLVLLQHRVDPTLQHGRCCNTGLVLLMVRLLLRSSQQSRTEAHCVIGVGSVGIGAPLGVAGL